MNTFNPFRATRSLIILFALVATLAIPMTATAATATGEATARIIKALTLSPGTGMNFGDMMPDAASAGTVVLTPGGARTCNTVRCMDSTNVAAGAFSVAGEASYNYTIALPTTAVTLTHGTDSTLTMSVDTFTDSASGTGALDTTGNGTFTVGATLNVGANQATGTYTGTYDVTVAYP